MKLKEFDIILDIKKANRVPYFEVVAGDFETNVLNITLIDGTPYSLDELSAEIVFAKPDGTTVVQDESNGVIIEDNIIKCTLASNTIAVSGQVFAEVRVLQGAKVLTSSRFRFYVRNPILNDKTVASSNQFPMLVQATEDAKKATQNAIDATQNAIDATQNAVIATENANTAAINAQEAAEQVAYDKTEVAENLAAILTEAQEAAEQIDEDKQTVAADKQTVLEKAEEALQSAAAALQSEINAKTSEDNAKDSETTAYEAMQTAVQAMTDLLAMLGEDIATLTGGKLTPSQIPAIAITDTFVRDSEAAMLALDCETGDICIRTDENKTYILQGTDPSKLSDWQQLKTPTNYADEAGHAVTADNAENANKINNKRLVAMTESQYENAVKDPDTFYAVVPDEE